MGKNKNTMRGLESLSVLLPSDEKKKYEEMMNRNSKISTEQDTQNANLGWLFYREYYDGLKNGITRTIQTKDGQKAVSVPNCLNPQKGDEEKVISIFFEKKNDRLIDESKRVIPEIKAIECSQHFTLTTIYPGLAIGTGINHETGLLGECKLGFQFDHTTGLPIIPGSSVKGLLRSMFPYSAYSKKNDAKAIAYRRERISFLQDMFNEIQLGFDVTDDDIKTLEMVVFEGVGGGNESISMYDRHIFFDAVVSNFIKGKGLLGRDYITPHKKPLKNPNPIQFLKVMPKVTFRFSFRLKEIKLTNGIITEEQQKKLFQEILRTVGIGAKTNVGYGQFE